MPAAARPFYSMMRKKSMSSLIRQHLIICKPLLSYDTKTNVVELPELFKWFSDDFGKRQGIIDLLSRYGIIGKGMNPSFTYTPWDWAPEPGRFN